MSSAHKLATSPRCAWVVRWDATTTPVALECSTYCGNCDLFPACHFCEGIYCEINCGGVYECCSCDGVSCKGCHPGAANGYQCEDCEREEAYKEEAWSGAGTIEVPVKLASGQVLARLLPQQRTAQPAAAKQPAAKQLAAKQPVSKQLFPAAAPQLESWLASWSALAKEYEHFGSADGLSDAISRGDERAMLAQLDMVGASLLTAKSSQGRTALQTACAVGRGKESVQLARILIRRGAVIDGGALVCAAAACAPAMV